MIGLIGLPFSFVSKRPILETSHEVLEQCLAPKILTTTYPLSVDATVHVTNRLLPYPPFPTPN